MVRILRLPDVLSRRGKSRTQHYNDVAAGLFTPPVKLSARACGWPEAETDALVRAVIAGRSADQIRSLVKELESARSGAA
jgi:prophage regulatory protein